MSKATIIKHWTVGDTFLDFIHLQGIIGAEIYKDMKGIWLTRKPGSLDLTFPIYQSPRDGYNNLLSQWSKFINYLEFIERQGEITEDTYMKIVDIWQATKPDLRSFEESLSEPTE